MCEALQITRYFKQLCRDMNFRQNLKRLLQKGQLIYVTDKCNEHVLL